MMSEYQVGMPAPGAEVGIGVEIDGTWYPVGLYPPASEPLEADEPQDER